MKPIKKLTQRKGFQITVVLIIGLLFFFTVYLTGNTIIERDYYKAQMLNFCGLAMSQQEVIKILNPDFELPD